ncbi:hypothetical protein R4227_06035 [Gordonia amicalis]|uniref:hypothetical protein n=1 Tax=Gordonia amicalis TaxID=89053 RepID=UPI002952E05F|nr:hypothetical protein [Gordonia amicalis]MDV7099701.1 hypothetical protein [Gordonia amicalis]
MLNPRGDDDQIFVVDDNDNPLAVIDQTRLRREGHDLAARLAATAGDPDALAEVAEAVTRERDAAAIGFLTATALSVMASEILPALYGAIDEFDPGLSVSIRAELEHVADQPQEGPNDG